MTTTEPVDVRTMEGAIVYSKTISESDVYMFAGITGDFYPVHIDAEYAAKQPVGERVAHGILLMGLMSTAAARWMLANGIDGLSYGYDKVRFIKPVKFNDTITIAYAKESATEDGKRTYAKVQATNQDGDVVGVATHIVYKF